MGASSVQLSGALTIVRDFLDEPLQQAWTNTQLTSYLNMGQADVQRKAEALMAELQITVTPNVQRYSAPTDTLRIYRLEYVPSNSLQTYGLEFRGYNEMDAVWGTYQQYTGAFPSLYTLWQNPPNLLIVTYPVPSQAGVLNCFYYRQPVAMVNNTDTMDCLPGFEDVIYDYAVYRALRQDADPRWKDQFTLYENNLTNMIDLSRRFTDQANWVSTGSSNVPAWLVTGESSWP
jgi:hypothetical protein